MAMLLQVPLLVVRPDAALKLNKLRIQPSMQPASAAAAAAAVAADQARNARSP